MQTAEDSADREGRAITAGQEEEEDDMLITADDIGKSCVMTFLDDGHTERGILVGGKNGAGKSSLLDAIVYALAGKKMQCPVPLRTGEKKGSVTNRIEDTAASID